MSRAGKASSSIGWAIFTVLGIVGWMGSTLFVAATSDDPSDATPILRTFAIAGGVFFGVAFGGAAIGAWRGGRKHVDDALYRRLAIRDVTPGLVRAARRGTELIKYVYFLFGAVTTGLMLTAIGLGEDGPTALLLYTAGAVVLVWLVAMFFTLGRLLGGAGNLLAPLGLSVKTVPRWVPNLVGGGGSLTGQLGFSGERHGRKVAIAQTPKAALTTIQGQFQTRTLSSSSEMAALAGKPSQFFRRVEATAGSEGITVRRKGNGAGRYMYYDLLLAESLAEEMVS